MKKWLIELYKQRVLESDKVTIFGICENCIYGEKTKVKFGTNIHKTKGRS